jgi:hypothetical protein
MSENKKNNEKKDEKMYVLMVRSISEEEHNLLKACAALEGKTLQGLMEELIDKYLAEHR